MKNFIFAKTFVAVAVALVVAGSQGRAQPIPAPAADIVPAGIVPGSALEQVYKLVRAGVDMSVVKNYISNSATAFNLDAEKIIALSDAGVTADIINAMMARDKTFLAAAATAAPIVPVAPPENPAPAPAPPAEPVTVNYFYNNLTPYGNWVEVEGYGRCWRPTVVVYDSNWSPYCDRGHWVYTDHGWYWDSYYSWGATFHYGRWFRHGRFGWCWYPDTVWAPSWVVWRSSDSHCGWAPLPPFSEYRPGVGFYYRGSGVSIGFDFGLQADCFTFVSVNRMCERHPRYYRENHERVTQIYNQTTIINNYNVNSTSQTVVNNGISVDRVRTVAARPIRPVAVAELPNAGRQGWRPDSNRPGGRPGNVANVESLPARPGQNPAVAPGTSPGSTVRQPGIQVRPGNDNNPPSRPPTTRPEPPNRGNSPERDNGNRNVTPPANNGGSRPNIVTPPVSGHERPQTPNRGNQPERDNGNRNVTPPPAATPPVSGHERTQAPTVRQPERPTATITRQPAPIGRQLESPVVTAPQRPQIQQPSPQSPAQPRQNVTESAPRNNPPREAPAPSSSSSQPGNRDRDRDRDKDKGNR